MSCVLPHNMKLHLDLSKEIVESHSFDWNNFSTHKRHPVQAKTYTCSNCGAKLHEFISKTKPPEYWIISWEQQKCGDRILQQIME